MSVPQAYVSEPMEGQLVSEGPVELCVAVRGSLEEAVPVLVETRGGGSAIGMACLQLYSCVGENDMFN